MPADRDPADDGRDDPQPLVSEDMTRLRQRQRERLEQAIKAATESEKQ